MRTTFRYTAAGCCALVALFVSLGCASSRPSHMGMSGSDDTRPERPRHRSRPDATKTSDTPSSVENGENPGTVPASGSVPGDDTSHVRKPDEAAGNVPASEENPFSVDERRRREIAIQYTTEAERAYGASDYPRALKLLDYALELDPGNATAARLRQDVFSLLGLGGSVSGSHADEEAALRQEAVFEVQRRVRESKRALDDGRFTEAIELAESAIDVIRWSGYLIEDDIAHVQAVEVVRLATQAREEQRLRDEATLKVEQRRKKALEAEHKLEQYRDEVRNLYVEAKDLFDRKEYTEAIIKLDQILIRDPFNEEVIDLKRIAGSLERGSQQRNAFERFNSKWQQAMAEIEAANVFPTDAILLPAHDHWEHVNDRADRLASQRTQTRNKDDLAVYTALESLSVNLIFENDTPLSDVIANIRKSTRLNIVTMGVDLAKSIPELTLTNIKLSDAFDILAQRGEFQWHVANGAVILATQDAASKDKAGERAVIDVSDILQNLTSYKATEPRLAEGNPGGGTTVDPRFTPDDIGGEDKDDEIDTDKLIDLIKETIPAGVWDDTVWPAPDIQRGTLIVRNTPEVIKRVRALVDDLRRSQGLEVSIDTRFITIRNDFLEDIGIDFRGVGGSPTGATPAPVAAALDDVLYGTNGNPAGVGTDNSAGFFFQDIANSNSVNEDIRGRVENLFDQAVGGRSGGFGLTNYGGMSMQLAFVDNPEVNAIVRAVNKKERATILASPHITVHNTQRGFVSVLNQIAYIRDFEARTTTGTAVGDPVVDIIRDGIVLDVRPTISADRRYVTLELRPTLATLLRPIPTITTSLGTGPPISIQTPELRLQRIRTTITLPDGGSFLVGGMRRMNEQDLDSGVPVLSDLPVVGWLFSRKALSTVKEDIIIIVSVRIIDPEEETTRRFGE